MSNAFLGQITMFAGNFAPKDWAFCNGQTLSIQQNTALFSLLGTAYGGNGVNTFQLPDLQSRLPVNQGQGAGLSPYVLGQPGGTDTVTIDQTMMPVHLHTFNATKQSATDAAIASTSVPASPNVSNASLYASPAQPPGPPLNFVSLHPSTVGSAGGNQPHSNLMPSLCISFVIALVGVFPSRN